METLLIDVTVPFATITLNRPDSRNAMNFAMMSELVTAFDELDANPEVRAIVLRGAGGNFCAGGDIKDMQAAAALGDDEEDALLMRMDGMLSRINHSTSVVIAVVEGAAVGGGFGLVCVSDFAIATSSAVFGMPEVRIGLVPSLISPYVIQRIGLTTARRLMLLGNRFDGQKAFDYGIISEVCAPDKLDDSLNALLGELRQCSRYALAHCKRLIFEVFENDISETSHYRAHLLNAMLKSEDAAEGLAAVAAKRPPKWAG